MRTDQAQDPADETLYSIGQFAKLTNISIKTLRYYHEEDVLTPAAIDEVTGYRSYTEEQLGVGQLLSSLRHLHLPVAALREFMADPTDARRLELFDRHIQQVEHEVAVLNNHLRTMRRKRAHPWPDTSHTVTAEERPSVPFVYLRYQTTWVNIEEARELAFAELRAYLAEHRMSPESPPTCLYPAGPMPDGNEVPLDVVAGFEVPALLAGKGRVHCGWAPGGTWFVTRHHGLYEYIGAAFNALNAHIRAQGGRVRHGYGDFVTAEVFRIGPWDTPDLGKLMTDVRWLVRPSTLGLMSAED